MSLFVFFYPFFLYSSLLKGLVLAPATGNVGADSKHSLGNYVLQNAYIASTGQL